MKINAPVTRKEFLAFLSGIAGTATFASKMPWLNIFNSPTVNGKKPSDRIRVGFIGIGSRGRTLMMHFRRLKRQFNLDIVAVCDTHEPHLERAKGLADDGARGFHDYRKMYDEVPMDLVVIATPLHEHAGMTLHALDIGIHVYVEKSMARTLDDIKAMYDACINSGKIMLIGNQKLFNPVCIKGIDMIQKGEIGPVTMLRAWWTRNRDWVRYDVPGGRGTPEDRIRNWRLYWETSGGMVTELGSHHFIIANWLMDGEPESVMGSGSLNFFKDGREVHDNFSLVFKYPGDVHFTYDCTQSNKFNGVEFQVLGNTGTMVLEGNKIFAEEPPNPPAIRKLIHNIESSLFETIPVGGATWIPAEPVKYGGEFISPDYELNDTNLYLEALIRYIYEGEAPRRLTNEGYKASVWALLAEEASRTGKLVTLPDKFKL